MIVYKMWRTADYKNRTYSFYYGYFLFGIIPLYVKNYHVNAM